MSTDNSTSFLGYLHSFRGFAIINIVIIHSVVAALVGGNAMDMSNPIALIDEVLFHDSTLYFAIISGLLFTAVLKKKGYKRFYRNKLQYVLLPYLFITVISVPLKFLDPELEVTGDSAILFYFKMLFRDILYGKAIAIFWYMPVLFFLYAVTPLVDYMIHLKKVGNGLAFILIITPLFVSRIQMAFEYILSIETMFYFLGAYVFGMVLGNNLDTWLTWMKKNFYILVVLLLISTRILFYLFINSINMVGTVSLQETFFYIQKLALTGVFITLFRNLGDQQPAWLHRFAKDSFGIYFLHGFFSFGAIPLFSPLLRYDSIAPFHSLLGSILIFVFATGMSMLIIAGFRKMAGSKSRMFVGS